MCTGCQFEGGFWSCVQCWPRMGDSCGWSDCWASPLGILPGKHHSYLGVSRSLIWVQKEVSSRQSLTFWVASSLSGEGGICLSSTGENFSVYEASSQHCVPVIHKVHFAVHSVSFMSLHVMEHGRKVVAPGFVREQRNSTQSISSFMCCFLHTVDRHSNGLIMVSIPVTSFCLSLQFFLPSYAAW
jgi:hypothetical protein